MIAKLTLMFSATILMSVFAIVPSTAMDLERRLEFDIPAQPLSSALIEFSHQAKIQVVTGNNLDKLTTPGINGSLAVHDALVRLLASSGLIYKVAGNRSISIGKVDMAAAPGEVTEELAGESVRLVQTEASSSADAGVKSNDEIQEIVVTAQKREERLIDVPQSVTVLTAASLEKLGATQFRDFADTIPGLSYQTSGPGYTQISLRGVTVGSDAGATVGIYVDDVPFGSSTTFARGGQTTLDAGLFDLSRIEVLRGPQGTLYGASAMGGIIKYVTNAPDSRAFTGELRTGISSTRSGDIGYEVSGMFNAPIATDRAAFRASGFYTRDGGYIDNVVLGRKDVNRAGIYGGRADLMLMPSERLTMRLTGYIQDIQRDGWPWVEFNLDGTPVTNDLEQSVRRVDEPFDHSFRLVSGVITYDTGPAELTSISSYQTTETHFRFYSEATSIALRPLNIGTLASQDASSTDKFTQELRLSSASGGSLEWLIGGYYTHEESVLDQHFVLTDLLGQPRANDIFTFRIPSTYEEMAAFGNLTWRPSSKFDVTGGIRYSWGNTKFEQIGTGLLGRSAPTSEQSDEVATYLANARYHFSDNATAYFRYATGYRPGGPNFIVVDSTTGRLVGSPIFESDTLKSYEVGFKRETMDRRFGVDLAAYYIEWDNIIINVTVGGFGARGNAPGGASVRGGELSLFARPIDGLTLTGAIGYQDAKLSDADVSLRAAAGERLPGVPRYTTSISADYEFGGNTFLPSIGATVRAVGERNSSYDASTSIPQYPLPAYEAVDLRARLTFNKIRAQLYVRNLFDTRAQLNTRFNSPAAGPITVSVLQPRTIGLSLSRTF